MINTAEKMAEYLAAGRPQLDDDGKPKIDLATCGTCGRTWNDALITEYTPAPSARCPFEYFHDQQPAKGIFEHVMDAARAEKLKTAKPTAEAVLREFIQDIEAVGVEQTAKEWPDLVITYRKAKAVEKCNADPGPEPKAAEMGNVATADKLKAAEPESLDDEARRVFGACAGKCGDAPCIAWNKAHGQELSHTEHCAMRHREICDCGAFEYNESLRKR